MKGFKSATFFGDPAAGEYGNLILWETKEDAEAAGAAMLPGVEQAIKGIATAKPSRKIYEIYESKA